MRISTENIHEFECQSKYSVMLHYTSRQSILKEEKTAKFYLLKFDIPPLQLDY
ncbi:unnamed protein product [Acanthoscelides obtectus]|uniref:Uncharacterized protein n=1 Tax=Acanthoscelides obtectus TaxID=200917 RepID=A0A9P0LCR2_ACAOB|nr:unnamed protein product [Acanthoscelides obtectus]CAK1674443.1 hypothetical protein AOBTE_LOCUS29621 [Acanthoscelides obtectus]